MKLEKKITLNFQEKSIEYVTVFLKFEKNNQEEHPK